MGYEKNMFKWIWQRLVMKQEQQPCHNIRIISIIIFPPICTKLIWIYYSIPVFPHLLYLAYNPISPCTVAIMLTITEIIMQSDTHIEQVWHEILASKEIEHVTRCPTYQSIIKNNRQHLLFVHYMSIIATETPKAKYEL